MIQKLLATSALVGATLFFSSTAFATPSITVGGFADFQAGFTDQDNAYQLGANSRDAKFQNDTEVHINAEDKTDGGLTYGAAIELEADVTADADNEGLNADKTYLYFQGGFGRVELGANTNAGEALRVDASSLAHATGGIDGDFYDFVNIDGVGSFIFLPKLPTSGAAGIREDATKMTYYSPRYSGVQVGLSYTPDQGNGGTAAGFSTNNDSGQQENVFNGGINYTGQYNELGVSASLTGEVGEAEAAGTEDLSAWAAGATLSYRGFSFGGSYADVSSDWNYTPNTDSNFWTLGGAYEIGPAGVSITYMDSETGSNDFNNLAVGADYQLAPGLVPYIEVNFFDIDPSGAAASNDGSAILIGTELTF